MSSIPKKPAEVLDPKSVSSREGDDAGFDVTPSKQNLFRRLRKDHGPHVAAACCGLVGILGNGTLVPAPKNMLIIPVNLIPGTIKLGKVN